ncbi:MAG: hypothetical protein FWD98_02050 [Defluviitaleaceae bacterium]|nr:hypothetical protein [Defluviitaleaceae bacterium]
MDNRKISIGTSNPALKDKITVNITDGDSAINWYMRFNIALDETTVSHKTMTVTDTDGYIMRTDISYDPVKFMIIISPLDTYEQGVYYILSVSKKVRSARGQYLKSKINIVFKLKDNKISEYRVLKSNVEVAPPRQRPQNYENMRESKAKLYEFHKKKGISIEEEIALSRVRIAEVDPKLIVPPIAGVAALLGGFFAGGQVLFFGGAAVAAAAFGYFIFSLTRPKTASALMYNAGAFAFNAGKYEAAKKLFTSALARDEYNEMAEYALNKVGFYLSEG